VDGRDVVACANQPVLSLQPPDENAPLVLRDRLDRERPLVGRHRRADVLVQSLRHVVCHPPPAAGPPKQRPSLAPSAGTGVQASVAAASLAHPGGMAASRASRRSSRPTATSPLSQPSRRSRASLRRASRRRRPFGPAGRSPSLAATASAAPVTA